MHLVLIYSGLFKEIERGFLIEVSFYFYQKTLIEISK